jgi:hypothetical protein
MGKTAEVVDTSILTIEDAARARAAKAESDETKGVEKRNERAFDDLTDWQNEDFVYVL